VASERRKNESSAFPGVWWWMKRGWLSGCMFHDCNQCFDTIGWVIGRASGPWKPPVLLIQKVFSGTNGGRNWRESVNPGWPGRRMLKQKWWYIAGQCHLTKWFVLLTVAVCFMSRNPAGYCFVEFSSTDAAQRAMLKLNGKIIPGTAPVCDAFIYSGPVFPIN